MICLALTGKTTAENLASIERYRSAIDLVELRADFLDPAETASLAGFPSKAGMPVILTLRRERDGGHFSLSEAERLALIRRILSIVQAAANSPYLDIEDDLPSTDIDTLCSDKGIRIIRSFHDFSGVPPDLGKRIMGMARSAGEIPKAAVMPKTAAELIRLMEVIRNPGISGDRIILGMGSFGFPTRVLAKRLGSFLTFTSPGGTSAAPGHLDPETLERVYRYREIGAETRIFGIIGNPVMHTRSPYIHNPAFETLGLDAVYLPFQLDDIALFPRLTEIFDIEGLSVTIPHKETVIPYLSSTDEIVSAVGACNTAVKRGNEWFGTNTDVPGFLAPLCERLGGTIPEGFKASVIGAGGASRAVVAGLRSAGAAVLILNRTPERAAKLANEFGCSWAALNTEGFALMREFSDAIVQTTSAGMTPNEDADPSEGYEFSGKEIAYDIIYHPLTTRFLKRAGEAGCGVIRGDEMLMRQGELQFSLFTGKAYPRVSE